jgi:hypothetical protein
MSKLHQIAFDPQPLVKKMDSQYSYHNTAIDTRTGFPLFTLPSQAEPLVTGWRRLARPIGSGLTNNYGEAHFVRTSSPHRLSLNGRSIGPILFKPTPAPSTLSALGA